MVAARGWDHPDWCGAFYPDDLPEDWRLAYYGNELSAVLVPAATWMQAEFGGPAVWLEEVGEDFRFHLELDAQLLAGGPSMELRRRVQPLLPRLDGVIVRGVDVLQLPTLRPWLDWLEPWVPTMGLLPAAPGATAAAGTPGLSPVWWSDGHGWADTPTGVRYGYVVAREALSLRELRVLAEGFRAAGGATLVFDGDPPSIDNLRQMMVILDLLG
jgi:hypothetical protein